MELGTDDIRTNPRSLIHEQVFQSVATAIRRGIDDLGYETMLRRRVEDALCGKGRLLQQGKFAPWPFLTLLAFNTAGGHPTSLSAPAAAAVELVVACADLIDDVQDGDVPGADPNAAPGGVLEVVAVLLELSSKLMLESAGAGVAPTRVIDAHGRLSRLTLRAMGGQHLDILYEQVKSPSLFDSLNISNLKSASLTQAAVEVGAALATGDGDLIDLYGRFGRQLGLMGQLMNDIAAVWPGGPRKSDLQMAKKTFPIVAGLQAAAQGDRRALPIASFFEQPPSEREATAELENALKYALWDCGAIRKAWAVGAALQAAASDTVRQLTQRVPAAKSLESLIS